MIGRALRLLAPPLVLACGALALSPPVASLAGEPGTSSTGTSAPAGEAGSTTTTTTAPSASPPEASTPEGEPAPSASSPASPEAETTATSETAPPQVQAQHAQSASPSGAGAVSPGKKSKKHSAPGGAGTGAGSTGGVRAKHKAPAPSTLTPGLPFSLRSPFGGLPSFFIESFQIPPFLLPIFQAAGTAYGIPWQVLAAINEVETDYGRDLSLSSAGAEGWMQFLPSVWDEYGVDANGDGWEDPYNPADAIFAAARYLHAAGGDTNIKAAVYAYNHSQAYVESVMLRAQLLGGTPPELLGAITGLTEARFPVYAPSHFSDGFATTTTGRTLAGTTIYSQEGAPVIAVEDGEVVEVGQSPSLGHFVALRDAYGNTYVYADLGEVASVYPVLEPHVHSAVSARIDGAGATKHEPAPSGPASAGAQPRSPLSEGAAISGLALGAAAGLEGPPSAPAPPPVRVPTPPTPPAHVRSFTAGPDQVYLHPLVPGVQVIAGTVLGHVGAASSTDGTVADGGPHVFFQIRPAGAGAPLIDPKPILDGWVALEETSIFRAKGENPFLATSPTVGQVLLESQQQLEPQVLHDGGIHLGTCARQDVQEGRVDKRVLAMLEYLSVSGLRPSISGLPCAPATPAAAAANVSAGATAKAVEITAVNGIPIAGHQEPGSLADETVRKLLMLQGISRPLRIVSAMSYPGAAAAITSPSAGAAIRVAFGALGSEAAGAHAASLAASGLAPNEWIELIDRLGEIPDPTVAGGHSSAAIPDSTTTASPTGEAGGND
jgi:murein DD-endopeptidase MepM/ murein hydrolase activator NlpD